MIRTREYTALVEKSEYPMDPAVPVDDRVVTPAGPIDNLLLTGCTSVAIIRSAPGTVRSNHYHKTDWHYLYVLEGEMDYYYRPAGSQEPPTKLLVRKGEMVFTPPMIEHATFFQTDTRLLSMAKNARTHEGHEADLVRIQLVKVVNGEATPCW